MRYLTLLLTLLFFCINHASAQIDAGTDVIICDIEDVVIRLLCELKTGKTPRFKERNHLGLQPRPILYQTRYLDILLLLFLFLVSQKNQVVVS